MERRDHSSSYTHTSILKREDKHMKILRETTPTSGQRIHHGSTFMKRVPTPFFLRDYFFYPWTPKWQNEISFLGRDLTLYLYSPPDKHNLFGCCLTWDSENLRERNLFRPPGHHPNYVICAGPSSLFRPQHSLWGDHLWRGHTSSARRRNLSYARLLFSKIAMVYAEDYETTNRRIWNPIRTHNII